MENDATIRALNAEKERLEKKIKEFRHYMFESNAISEIIAGRIKAQEILENYKGNYKKISKLFEPLARREKELFAISEKEKKYQSQGYMKKFVKLESELNEINNQIYCFSKRSNK